MQHLILSAIIIIYFKKKQLSEILKHKKSIEY